MKAIISTSKVITTKYLGPTNFRGSRVKAMAYGNAVTMDWQHELSIDENHLHAAKELTKKYNWPIKKIIGGQDKNGAYQWVLL